MATLQHHQAQRQPQRRVVLTEQQKQQLQLIQRRMRKVKNQMDFLEILSNFWPLANMDSRVDRLESEMTQLNQQYQRIRNPFRV